MRYGLCDNGLPMRYLAVVYVFTVVRPLSCTVVISRPVLALVPGEVLVA